MAIKSPKKPIARGDNHPRPIIAARVGKPILEPVDEVSKRWPRTLIVSWHWPPTNRASTGVLENLFRSAPDGAFRVITRSFPSSEPKDRRPPCEEIESGVPATHVATFLDEHAQPTMRDWPALTRTIRGMVRTACEVGRGWDAEGVLAVYPHRCSLLAGWSVARRLRIPLFLYMHDLCAEALMMRNPLRRWLWRRVDRLCLDSARLVIVPTEEFAEHYRRRGVHRCWVLPHCAPRVLRREEPPEPTEHLRLLYSGAVYEPHADSMQAFIAATRDLSTVRVTYQSHPDGCNGLMGQVGARWLRYAETQTGLSETDVFVVVLGLRTPYPSEVHGCFPSKLIEYLSVGRPILAVVPKGSFVDRLVSQSGCGVVVHRHDTASIRSAIDLLRDPRRRRTMARAARSLIDELKSDLWMRQLLERLRDGPAEESSLPAFPRDAGNGE